MDRPTLQNYVARYKHKADVVRTIHSQKAEFCRKADLIYSVFTIALGAMATFLGFTGSDRLQAATRRIFDITSSTASPNGWLFRLSDSSAFQALFNLGVLGLFVVSLLNLIFRWKENHALHFQGVVRLTQFNSWLDQIVILGTGTELLQRAREIRVKYDNIVELLPPSADGDYERAKAKIRKRQEAKNPRSVCARLKRRIRLIFGDCSGTGGATSSVQSIPPPTTTLDSKSKLLASVALQSPRLMAVLRTLRDFDSRMWLGGGAVRNYVWDFLTGRTTIADDVDVVFVDHSVTDKQADLDLQTALSSNSPLAVRWSVRNQVRMVQQNKEPHIQTIEDAVALWPETATAIALRLNDDGEVEVIAPHGVDDLFALKIAPTPYHSQHRASYEARLTKKSWGSHWPEVKISQ